MRDRLDDMSIERFLPLMNAARRSRVSARREPLFPGYLFARLSVEAGDLPKVRWLHGVKRVLGDGHQPRPIDEQVVEEIKRRADAGGCVTFGLGLRPGKQVKILQGPFEGLVGVLEGRVTRPDDRVHVLLDIFARTARVTIPASSIVGIG